MAKKSKKTVFPDIANVEFVERLDDGVGLGRFRVRLSQEDAIADLVILDPTITSQEEWLQKLTEQPEGPWPKILASGTGDHTWIAFSVTAGVLLSQRLAEATQGLPEIDALNIVMQMAVQLTLAHEHGVPHGSLNSEVLILEPTEGGLDRVHIVSWLPQKSDTDLISERTDLMALGQMHYQLLTGVLPPSAQSASSDLEGDSAGAFDDVLMDWIDEDRDLQGLGQPAVEALAETSRFETVSAFVEALQPHFMAHLNKTIDETGEALHTDRNFMVEVEKQRRRLKELESRQRFIRDWLFERVERIEHCEDELDMHHHRLRSLENLQTQIEFSIGQSRVGENQAIKSVLSAWNPDDEIEPIEIEEAVMSVAPPSMPPEALNPLESTDEEHEEIEPPPFKRHENSTDQPGLRLGLGASMFMLLVLVVLGGLGAAWILDTSGDQALTRRSHSKKPSPDKVVKHDGSIRGAHATTSKAKVEKRDTLQPTALPKGTPTAPGKSRAVGFAKDGHLDRKNNDLGVKKAVPDSKFNTDVTDALDMTTKNEGDAERAMPPDSRQTVRVIDAGVPKSETTMPTYTGEVLPTGPAEMVAIRGGELWLGLDREGVTVAMGLCKADRLRSGADGCDVLSLERSNKTVQIKSFYLDQFEVSQTDYNLCRAARVCRQYGPKWKVGPSAVTGISHKQAEGYCRWAGKRLPTYEEWLYAARGPSSRRLFPWGNEPPKDGKLHRANFGSFRRKGGAPYRGDGHKYVAPVTSFKDVPSPFKIANLVGNVREWTSSEREGRFRLAGGSWQSAAHRLRVTRADFVTPTIYPDDVGVRCAKSAKVKQ